MNLSMQFECPKIIHYTLTVHFMLCSAQQLSRSITNMQRWSTKIKMGVFAEVINMKRWSNFWDNQFISSASLLITSALAVYIEPVLWPAVDSVLDEHIYPEKILARGRHIWTLIFTDFGQFRQRWRRTQMIRRRQLLLMDSIYDEQVCVRSTCSVSFLVLLSISGQGGLLQCVLGDRREMEMVVYLSVWCGDGRLFQAWRSLSEITMGVNS